VYKKYRDIEYIYDTVDAVQPSRRLLEIPDGKSGTLSLSKCLVQFPYEANEKRDFHSYADTISRSITSRAFYNDKLADIHEHSKNICFVFVCTSCNDRHMRNSCERYLYKKGSQLKRHLMIR
jgi:hypothetical protein